MRFEKLYDIIVIGGGPAGVISAVTSRKDYPKKKILLIKSIDKGVIPCGIPYMFTTLKKPEDNLLTNDLLKVNNIMIKVDEVIKINKEKKMIITKKNTNFKYKKLILATGSNPIILPIKGINKKNVYPIYKEINYLKSLKNKIKKSKNIVIIGGGFIGVEFADELSKLKNVNVSIIELLPRILANSFDEEFSELATKKLIEKGVKIYINLKADKINGKEKVKSILLSNGKTILADLVILGIGAKPNISLAKKAGLKTSKRGILVDKALRTSNKNISAVGDCSEKTDFFTREKISVMLASTATTEARIASRNLFGKFVRKKVGTISSYSTKIEDLVLSSTGIIEKTAAERGLKIIVGNAESFDKHPKSMPNISKIKVKLIFSELGTILGGQIAGGESAGEMINIISTAIQKKFSLSELEDLQIATHPKLTPAPTSYPIINAAQNALQN